MSKWVSGRLTPLNMPGPLDRLPPRPPVSLGDLGRDPQLRRDRLEALARQLSTSLAPEQAPGEMMLKRQQAQVARVRGRLLEARRRLARAFVLNRARSMRHRQASLAHLGRVRRESP